MKGEKRRFQTIRDTRADCFAEPQVCDALLRELSVAQRNIPEFFNANINRQNRCEKCDRAMDGIYVYADGSVTCHWIDTRGGSGSATRSRE